MGPRANALAGMLSAPDAACVRSSRCGFTWRALALISLGPPISTSAQTSASTFKGSREAHAAAGSAKEGGRLGGRRAPQRAEGTLPHQAQPFHQDGSRHVAGGWQRHGVQQGSYCANSAGARQSTRRLASTGTPDAAQASGTLFAWCRCATTQAGLRFRRRRRLLHRVALWPGDGSIGARSEAAAGVLAAASPFDKGLLFGCGTLASQSTGQSCHVYVAPCSGRLVATARYLFRLLQARHTVLSPSKSAAS